MALGFRRIMMESSMIRSTALLLVLAFPIYCSSQNWADNHSIWHYEQINITPPYYEDYIKFSTIGDTVILGDVAKIIKEESFSVNGIASSKNIYMKSDTSKVYLYVPSINSYKLIYDFSAAVGDTIDVYCRDAHEDSTIRVVIDSLSFVEIDSVQLKVQYTHQYSLTNTEYYMGGEIIENIGWKDFMFPLHSFADPPYGGALRCYQNDTIGLIKFSNIDCDYISTNITETVHPESVQIFPNPTKGTIKIQIKNIIEVKITDLTNGRCIYNGKENSIDLSNQQSGIYIIQLTTDKGIIIDKIILK